MDERPWAALLGLPVIIGVPTCVAIGSAVGGLEGLLVGIFAGFLVFIVIGIAMTVAKRS